MHAGVDGQTDGSWEAVCSTAHKPSVRLCTNWQSFTSFLTLKEHPDPS